MLPDRSRFGPLYWAVIERRAPADGGADAGGGDCSGSDEDEDEDEEDDGERSGGSSDADEVEGAMAAVEVK